MQIYDVIPPEHYTQFEAIEWLTNVYYEAEITIRDDSESLIRHCNLVGTVENGTLDIWYDYAGDYYFCAVNEN
jgi:hypothetical protein